MPKENFLKQLRRQIKQNFVAVCVLLIISLKVMPQCESVPTIKNTGKILKELNVKKSQPDIAGNFSQTEFGLSVKASVKGASWQKAGAEAAVLTIFVDGKYNQDAILFAGEEVFEYQMLLGKFDLNKHKITIVLNQTRSAPNARNVRIHSAFAFPNENSTARAEPKKSSILDYFAAANAPVIYLRPDTIDKFSDVPLLTFYEIFDEPENIKRIRYTIIFTNEDGGTQSAALMARWGRMTDIEWIYEIRISENGEILSEIYQAANHETKMFKGNRFGSHPLILDATVNNNFADAGCSSLRVSPMLVNANLSNGSRETVMDNFPWTYRIMAHEALREGRVNPANLGANTIDDPRDYLYAEIYSELKGAAIALEAETSDGAKFTSDQGKSSLRVNRNGYVRIAMRLPRSSVSDFPTSLTVGCYATSNNTPEQEISCQNVRVAKLVRLDQNFMPTANKIDVPPQNIKVGGKAVFAFAQRTN